MNQAMSDHRMPVALIGARGYTGAELLRLLAGHDALRLALAASGESAGRPIASEVPEWPDADQCFQALTPDDVGSIDAKVWVLAVPNGKTGPWTEAIGRHCPDAVIVDLSADHRFDPAWAYGLPELNRPAIRGARRIANPGCYATAAQLGLAPLAGRLTGAPVVFGVSGYSGAGRTPNPRNDPERLRDNLIPYSLTGHVHEREISTRLGTDVRFHPHVAPFFRGISLTIATTLQSAVDADQVHAHYTDFYAGERLVRVRKAIPEIRDLEPRTGALIGGFAVDARDPTRLSLVVVLDNLLKGAASQAMQNIHLALGLDEFEGLG
ncbi:MAG: N-acetyl-gamma-glutamyl-phosphate reductase [Wenzhouxiangellaceae bacterium]